MFNGTGANVVGLQSMVRSFESRDLRRERAHQRRRVRGAGEAARREARRRAGARRQAHRRGGRRARVWGIGDPHHVQAQGRVASRSRPSCGTVYTARRDPRARRLRARARHAPAPRRRADRQRRGVPRRRRSATSGPPPASTCCPSAPRRTARWAPRPWSCCSPELAGVDAVPAQAVDAARVEDALHLRAARRAARPTTCGGATPSTPTRWPRASPPRVEGAPGVTITDPVAGQRRVRDPRPPRRPRRSSRSSPSTCGARTPARCAG